MQDFGCVFICLVQLWPDAAKLGTDSQLSGASARLGVILLKNRANVLFGVVSRSIGPLPKFGQLGPDPPGTPPELPRNSPETFGRIFECIERGASAPPKLSSDLVRSPGTPRNSPEFLGTGARFAVLWVDFC